MSKVTHLATASTLTIFNGTDIIVQVMCSGADEINAILARYSAAESAAEFTYTLEHAFSYVVE